MTLNNCRPGKVWILTGSLSTIYCCFGVFFFLLSGTNFFLKNFTAGTLAVYGHFRDKTSSSHVSTKCCEVRAEEWKPASHCALWNGGGRASFYCLSSTEKWMDESREIFQWCRRAKVTSCFVLGVVSFSSQWGLCFLTCCNPSAQWFPPERAGCEGLRRSFHLQ